MPSRVVNSHNLATIPIATFGTPSAVLVEIRSAKTLIASGNETGRGAIRFIDTIANRSLEIGFYAYGAGIFVNNLFETFSQGFSLRSYDQTGTRLYIRNPTDTGGLELYDDGALARIKTEGTSSPILIMPNDTLAIYCASSGRTVIGGSQTDDGVNALQVNGTIGFKVGGAAKATIFSASDASLTLKGTGSLIVDSLVSPALSGQRYLVIDSAGRVTSSATAPTGT